MTEAMSSVYSDRFEGVAFRSGAELARFEADARALWAVRVLDRHAARYPSYVPVKSPYRTESRGWGHVFAAGFHPNPDAARIAAAEALVAEDPSLGEGT